MLNKCAAKMFNLTLKHTRMKGEETKIRTIVMILRIHFSSIPQQLYIAPCFQPKTLNRCWCDWQKDWLKDIIKHYNKMLRIYWPTQET